MLFGIDERRHCAYMVSVWASSCANQRRIIVIEVEYLLELKDIFDSIIALEGEFNFSLRFFAMGITEGS